MEKEKERTIVTRLIEVFQELDVDTRLNHSSTGWTFYASRPDTYETIFSISIYDAKEAERVIKEIVKKL